MAINLNTSHTVKSVEAEVRYHEGKDDYSIQVFLGDSFTTMYMSAEDARVFAYALLAVLPAKVKA